MTSHRAVVATVLFGDYERLTEQPIADDSDARFVCFTDDEELTSRTWSVEVIRPRFPSDIVRSARHVKIMLSSYLPEAPTTLWMDNSVVLLSDPVHLLEDWLRDCEIASPIHSFRQTLEDEFAVVAEQSLDDPARIYEQYVHYTHDCPDVLTRPPLWTGLMARRRSPRVDDAMALWMDHVLRYSRRDQLSVTAAMSQAGVVAKAIEVDNHVSFDHRWPVAVRSDSAHHRRRFSAAVVPDRLRDGSQRPPDRAVESELASLREERDGLLASLRDREESLQRLGSDVAELQARARSSDDAVRELRNQLQDIANSRTIRWTQPARTLIRRSRTIDP